MTVAPSLKKSSMEELELFPEHGNGEDMSPILRQYRDFKALYPDAIVLFEVGDSYEAYEQDAEAVDKILHGNRYYCGIFNKHTGKEWMHAISFPHYNLDVFLPKLVKAGKKVAICEPLEKPMVNQT